MTRLHVFHEMNNHAMHGKLYRRLSAKEVELCIKFIEDHDHLGFNDFATKVNRWTIDSPRQRTKHHNDMWALIMQANQIFNDKREDK